MEKKMQNGINFWTIVSLMFIGAKLWGLVDWSWWICFLPELIIMGLRLIQGICELITAKWKKEREEAEAVVAPILKRINEVVAPNETKSLEDIEVASIPFEPCDK